MATVPGYTFTIGDPRTSTDEEIAEGVELTNTFQAEFFPEEPPTEVATAIAATRAAPGRFGMWRVRVRDANGLLVSGAGTSKDWENDTNPDVGGIGGRVRAGHRGKGIGTALLAWQVAFCQALGQTRLLLHTDSRLPASEPIALALGAEVKSHDHENRLLLADVDVALMNDWVESGQQQPDYELLAFDGAIPDELAQAYVDLVLVMNTAPRDDLQVNDFTFTVAELREYEERTQRVGAQELALVVRHRPSGDLVGVHTLYFSPDDREKAFVGITGVVPEHRGHGLGRLLKATLTLRLLAERPQILCVVTGNADSNGPMLAINEAMGYRPHASSATWEVSRAHVEQLLTSRGVEIPYAEAAEAVATHRTGELTPAL